MAMTRRSILRLQTEHGPKSTTLTNGHSSNRQIESRTPQYGQSILAEQRHRRPVSPHLSIYKWQVHSVSSAMERNTGMVLSGSLYLSASSYLVAPYLGWELTSAGVATALAALPVAAKVVVKFALAWPFTFHVLNGARYVAAAGGRTLSDKNQFVRNAWAVVGASFVSAAGLVALL